MWVEALRSGEFKPSKHTLENKGYCCLGVACVVAEKNGIKVRRENGVLAGYSLADQKKVQDWLGLYQCEGRFRTKKGGSTYLSVVNDRSEENPFAEIADIIESEPAGLFVD